MSVSVISSRSAVPLTVGGVHARALSVPALVRGFEASHSISAAWGLSSLALARVTQPVILVLDEKVRGQLVAPRTVRLFGLAGRRVVEHVTVHGLGNLCGVSPKILSTVGDTPVALTTVAILWRKPKLRSKREHVRSVAENNEHSASYYQFCGLLLKCRRAA